MAYVEARGLKSRLEIDTRGLAVFRILLGMLLGVDLLLRSRNLVYFYTGEGVVSRELARQATVDHAFSVLYLLPDEPWITAAFFAASAAVALQLTVGYRSRLATVLALTVAVSVDHRNPYVLSYADALFALLLFWGVFLPLGERWSVDALYRTRRPRDSVFILAAAAALAQMVVMYLVNGVHKLRSTEWLEGDAVGSILAGDEVTYLLGEHLHLLPDTAFVAANYIWLTLMLTSPLLLVFTGWRRSLYAGVYGAGHLSLAFVVRIGGLPFVSITGLTLFASSSFWDAVEHQVQRPLEDHDPSTARAIDLLQRQPSVLPTAFPSTYLEPRHRDAFSTLVFVLVAVSTAYMLTYNAGTVAEAGGVDDFDMPGGENADDLFAAFGVDQPAWDIFAPEPKDMDVYYVVAAEIPDGDVVDLWSDGEVTWKPPDADLSQQYSRGYRERFYMEALWESATLSVGGVTPEVEYAEYHCSNRMSGSEEMEFRRLELHYLLTPTAPDTIDQVNALQMLQHSCRPGEVAPLPVVTPPEEYRPVDGGHEKRGGKTLVEDRTDVSSLGSELRTLENEIESHDGRCDVSMESLDAGELHEEVKHRERRSYYGFGEPVTSVGVHTLDLARYGFGLRYLYHVRVYTTETGVHSPRSYVVEYTVSEAGLHRRIPRSSEGVSTEHRRYETGYLSCPG